jgi:hypothetical protein
MIRVRKFEAGASDDEVPGTTRRWVRNGPASCHGGAIRTTSVVQLLRNDQSPDHGGRGVCQWIVIINGATISTSLAQTVIPF